MKEESKIVGLKDKRTLVACEGRIQDAARDAIRGGYRFPACAKPVAPVVIWLDASAGEGRSEKIMLHE